MTPPILKNSKNLLKLLFLISLFWPSAHAEDFLSQPQILNDENTQISFEVDSTWVLVEGQTSGINGKITPGLDSSWHTSLTVPVKNMLTGLGARDSKLQRIMAAQDFPEVQVELQGSSKECSPDYLKTHDSCLIKQSGSLTIRGITREVTINAILARVDHDYVASGEIIFPWAAFGIEDPSILVAKLAPEVKVLYKVVVKS